MNCIDRRLFRARWLGAYEWLLVLFLLPFLGLTFLFSYNSGFGYDALEYLVLGRGITEGVPLYEYAPSKSPGIYYFVALLIRCGLSFGHVCMAAVITVLAFILVCCSFFVFRAWSSRRNALLCSVLVGVATQFTELNFLETEGFVALFGLLAWYFMNGYLRESRFLMLALCGLSIGLGILFKSVAILYGFAAISCIALDAKCFKAGRASDAARSIVMLTGILLIPVLSVWSYFLLTGRSEAYVEYTFIFPAFRYPGSTAYLGKFFLKLLWIIIFVGAGFALLVKRQYRLAFLSDKPSWTAAIFGACASVALLKTQASHYAFPAVPFLLFASTKLLLSVMLKGDQTSRHVNAKLLAAAAVAVVGLAAFAAVLYRPAVLDRFTRLRDFEREEKERRLLVESLSPPSNYILFTSPWNTTSLYWIGHRYPPPPYISMDVKTIWTLRNRPERVLQGLSNKCLYVVEFNDRQLVKPELEDEFGERKGDIDIMRRFRSAIVAQFVILRRERGGTTYWVRRSIGSTKCTTAQGGKHSGD